MLLAIRAVRPVPLRYDDGFFLLVSYSWKNGLGFNNPWIDLIGSGIYNWHGFLQPLVVSAMSLLQRCRRLVTARFSFSVRSAGVSRPPGRAVVLCRVDTAGSLVGGSDGGCYAVGGLAASSLLSWTLRSRSARSSAISCSKSSRSSNAR